MNRNTKNILIGIVLALAVVGLITSLINEPLALFKNLLIGALVAGVIIFIVYRFSNSRANPEQQAYKKAAKMSAKRNNQKHPVVHPHPKHKKSKAHTHGLTVISREHALNKPKQKSTTHLTVIEGKKARKKSRAFF